MKVAAIGIGSNSLRMLVARVESGVLLRCKRYRKGLRMFAALDAQKNLSQEMIDTACQNILEFKNEALAEGAETVHLFATSAVRDAKNNEYLAKCLLEGTGLELDICSGDVEATLSFFGATEGVAAGMIDIGGGSTELAVGKTGKLDDAVSLQMGAVRLFREKAIQNVEDAEEVVRMASEIIKPVQNRFADQNNALSWVGVGGTFTTSAALVQKIPWEQRDKIHGFVMKKMDVKNIMEMLAPMTLDERLKLPGLQPQRADIVVHGIAILLACMNMLNIDQIMVSEYGNLEGYLKSKYIF